MSLSKSSSPGASKHALNTLIATVAPAFKGEFPINELEKTNRDQEEISLASINQLCCLQTVQSPQASKHAPFIPFINLNSGCYTSEGVKKLQNDELTKTIRESQGNSVAAVGGKKEKKRNQLWYPVSSSVSKVRLLGWRGSTIGIVLQNDDCG